jgi:hypothetical protein
MTALQPTPNVAWPPGTYLTTPTGNDYYWDGTSWQPGRAPLRPGLASAVREGTPGTFIPPTGMTPLSKQELDTMTSAVAWTFGSYVSVAGNDYFWDGAAWQPGRAPIPPATSVLSGTPGVFVPLGSIPPATKAALDPLPGGATTWISGEYITVGGQDYHWNGTAWLPGRTPLRTGLATGAVENHPGLFTPPGATAPANKMELDTVPGGTAWATPGDWIAVGPSILDEYYWDGSAWIPGRVPGVVPATAHAPNLPNGDAQVTTTAISGTALAPVAGALPTEVQFEFTPGAGGGTLGVKWNPIDYTLHGGLRSLNFRYVSEHTGALYFDIAMTPVTRTDVTVGLSNLVQTPESGDIIYLIYRFIDGTVQILKAVTT